MCMLETVPPMTMNLDSGVGLAASLGAPAFRDTSAHPDSMPEREVPVRRISLRLHRGGLAAFSCSAVILTQP